MVAWPLVEEQIENGRRLIPELRRPPFDLKLAYRRYLEDSESWRLFLATDLVETDGPRRAYQVLSETVRGMSPPPEFSPSELSVIGPHQPIVRALQDLIAKYPAPLVTRIRNAPLGDEFVDEVYVYTDPPPSKDQAPA